MKKYKKEALLNIENEMFEACKKFPPFHSCHEGYAIIKEELEELWDDIKIKPRNMKKIEEEATQVGAMALRFLIDLCGYK